MIYLVEADHRYDLTNVPQTLLETFLECGVCLSDLEEKLNAEEIVYDANKKVSAIDGCK